jgi:hypothetical protein
MLNGLIKSSKAIKLQDKEIFTHSRLIHVSIPKELSSSSSSSSSKLIVLSKIKFWNQLLAYLYLIYRGPHRKHRVQQSFSCCIYIHGRGNVSNEHVKTHSVMGRIYEVRHYIHIRLHVDWFRHSDVDNWEYTDTQACRQHGNLKAYFYIFEKRKVGRKEIRYNLLTFYTCSTSYRDIQVLTSITYNVYQIIFPKG